MIAEISLLCLILALGLSGLQSLAPVPTVGLALRSVGTWGQSLLALLAFIGLGALFLSNDFSVLYVANNSNLDLPLLYKISAIWGAHEGSLLLWSLILAFWTVSTLTQRFRRRRGRARLGAGSDGSSRYRHVQLHPLHLQPLRTQLPRYRQTAAVLIRCCKTQVSRYTHRCSTSATSASRCPLP